ncbi:multiple myeloma tumor-associated protein 2 [Polypterus senegalus]|uniref:multiple myeloma tumor-associated protein 2 n=1 Tax=Polypterus senegalus TaxID=55291 RepID=UPI00196555C3|nr:multiple myeloma tumor-associated protein 2 [Polypterus senegalus]
MLCDCCTGKVIFSREEKEAVKLGLPVFTHRRTEGKKDIAIEKTEEDNKKTDNPKYKMLICYQYSEELEPESRNGPLHDSFQMTDW